MKREPLNVKINKKKRKRERMLKLRMLLTAVVICFVAVTYMNNSNKTEAQNCVKYEITTVSKGDTLWSIAKTYATNEDVRRVMYDIECMNNINNGVIVEGQTLKIPSKYCVD